MSIQSDTDIAFAFVDVFADHPLEGNPVTVVLNADRLAESEMQRIAREFNQAETTFVLQPTRPGADWRVRAFTPAGMEASGGAGHHTVGTWWWLAESGVLSLDDSGGAFWQEDGDRLHAVQIVRESGRLHSVGMSQAPPEFGRVCEELPALATALNLSPTDFAIDALPAQVVSTGVPHLLVPLRDRGAVDRAQPDFDRLAPILHGLQGEGCYLYTRDTILPGASAYARFFNPTLGILEDVATGTAAGPLACQLVAHRLASDNSTVLIEQGHKLHRPSVIRIRVSGPSVTISGRCVVSGTGMLRLR